MLKMLGCGLILSASIGYAIRIRQELKEHLFLLYEIRKMLTNLLYEEQYSLQPVENILLYSIHTKDERLNEICREIGQTLLKKEAADGAEIWRMVFEKKRKLLGMNEEEAEIVESAGSAYFGKSMEENQKVLSLYLERLHFQIEIERKERKEKQKVYQTVSIMCGLILIILLV